MANKKTAVAIATDADAFAEQLKKSHGALKRLLGSEEMARKAAAVTFVLVRRTPALQECSVESIMNGMLQASQYNLELGTEAHLVPYKSPDTNMKEASFIPDWKGLVRLAIRCGAITRGHGDLVYPRDEFVYRRTGEGVEFLHDPERFGERAAKDTFGEHKRLGAQGVYWIGYCAAAPPVVATLSLGEVEYVRQTYSKAKDGPMWAKRWSSGAIKTAAKQALKSVPQSRDLREVIELDNRFETGTASGVVEGDFEEVQPYSEPKPIAAPAEETEEEVRAAEQAELLAEQQRERSGD